MADQHALVTGPIAGRIPTPSKKITGDNVDVTPDILYFDSEAEALAVGEAIGDEHEVRGTGPYAEDI